MTYKLSIIIIGILILPCCQNINNIKNDEINCIKDFKFSLLNYPSPLTMLATLDVKDTALYKCLLRYPKCKPEVKYYGRIFKDSSFSYKMLKFTHDSLTYFTLASWVTSNSLDWIKSKKEIDSLSIMEFASLSIEISAENKTWILNPCRNK